MDTSPVASEKKIKSDDSKQDLELYELEHEPFYIISNKFGYKYFQVNLSDVNINQLKKIVDACEVVEKASWEAQENFFNFFKKCHLLTYIMKDGQMVGFQLVSYWVIDRYVAVDFDETMVLKEHRGHQLGFALCTVSARYLYIMFHKNKDAKFTLLTYTPNPRIVRLFFKYKILFSLMPNTFRPNDDLMMVHDKLLFRKKMSLVHKDYPFVFKNLFPGSLRYFETKKYPKKLQKMLPDGVDFFERGDAFSFMAIFSKYKCWPGITGMMLRFFGKNFVVNDHLGLGRKSGRIKQATL